MSESQEHSKEHTTSAQEKSSLNPNLHNYASPKRLSSLDSEEYLHGIKEGDRVVLSQAITLLESVRPDHQSVAQKIVNDCLPHAGGSIRIAVTGAPGVGKSTFIECLGQLLVENGRRLAILTIDPTSERSKGSILGDKTRMGRLASLENVYIRPSPTSGQLGGVGRKTRESIFLCEAAGYDTILVETVGVGQSEVTVRTMVDFFLLLALPGAGDELQGIKRGIVEMADGIAINKADGENRTAAKTARREYERALKLLAEPESGWSPPVHTCSAQTGDGIETIWTSIREYRSLTRESGFFERRRRQQAQHWMYQTIEDMLRDEFFATPDVESTREKIEDQVLNGELSSVAAAQQLMDRYRQSVSGD